MASPSHCFGQNLMSRNLQKVACTFSLTPSFLFRHHRCKNRKQQNKKRGKEESGRINKIINFADFLEADLSEPPRWHNYYYLELTLSQQSHSLEIGGIRACLKGGWKSQLALQFFRGLTIKFNQNWEVSEEMGRPLELHRVGAVSFKQIMVGVGAIRRGKFDAQSHG